MQSLIKKSSNLQLHFELKNLMFKKNVSHQSLQNQICLWRSSLSNSKKNSINMLNISSVKCHRCSFSLYSKSYKDIKTEMENFRRKEKSRENLNDDYKQRILEMENKIAESINAESISTSYTHTPYVDKVRYRKRYSNPAERAFGIIRDDILEFVGQLKNKVYLGLGDSKKKSNFEHIPEEVFPSYCDVVIIGGGLAGMSTAYHMQDKALKGLDIVVVEQDQSYTKASSVLSVGGIRQQFSISENIKLSSYGYDFLRQSKEKLRISEETDPPDVNFNFQGYLTLASEDGHMQLLENYETQRENKCSVRYMTPEHIKETFPWINTDGITAGVYGTQREGWFDPWSLLLALSRKTRSLGTRFVHGHVYDAELEFFKENVVTSLDHMTEQTHLRRINKVKVHCSNGEEREIHAAAVVLAAGHWSGEVGRALGVGVEKTGVNSFAIPVEPRKRYVYCVHSPRGPGINCPLVINPNGSYFRREGLGDLYICGSSPPSPDYEPKDTDLSNVDYDFFNDVVWPSLAERVEGFEELKIQSAWAGNYDYNTFDQNGIIGHHPCFVNLLISTGFSGHGIQQTLGAGRALMELLCYSDYVTINLDRLAFDRIVMGEAFAEKNIY